MKLAILLIPAAFLIISYSRNKSISDPYVAFNTLWLAVAVLISVGNKYVYEPTNTALICVLVGIIGFNISMFTPNLIFGKRGIGLFKCEDYYLDYYRLYILSLIVLILSALGAASAIRAFLSGTSFGEIRTDYYTLTSSEDTYMYYFKEYVLSPLRYVVLISTIIGVLNRKKGNKWLIINTIGIVILQAITTGGRYVLMNTIFMMLCGYSLYGDKEKITIKQKVTIVIAVLLFSYIIVFLTNDRVSYLTQDMTVGERLYHTVYEYFVGSTTYLGEVVKKTPSLVGSTYGINFIAGFIIPIFAALTFLHILPYPAVFSVIGTYACEILRIGPATYYNAMPTIFGYFLIDGGYILTFVEAWLFGYICRRLYQRGKGGNLLMSAMFILIFVQVCNSSTRWFFYSSDYCLAFLYLNTVIRKSIGGYLLLVLILQTIDWVWGKYDDKLREKLDRTIGFCCGKNSLAGKWGAIA